jgi:8-oxo-dGTP pyrophosphatase MutT (NUDIX family)
VEAKDKGMTMSSSRNVSVTRLYARGAILHQSALSSPTTMQANWNNLEVGAFWPFIERSLDRLVRLCLEIEQDGLHWRPPAPQTNSLCALAVHAMGNAEENILGLLAREPISRSANEFDDANISRESLEIRWNDLRARLDVALRNVEYDLDLVVQHPRRGDIPARHVLIVVARHAAEHLGQAELTQDLWRAELINRTAEALTPSASIALFDSRGRILLGQRRDSLAWCLPGGKMEPGESYADCIRRECREELGFNIEIDGLLGVGSDPARGLLEYPDGRRLQFIGVCFRGRLGERNASPDGELLKTGWFAADELPSPIHPPNLRTIQYAFPASASRS